MEINKFLTLSLLLSLIGLFGCKRSVFNAEQRFSTHVSGPSLTWSSMTISPDSIADGITATEVTLIIKNAKGDPLVGISMDLTVSGSQNTIVPCSLSDINGASKCLVYSTVSENKLIQATGSLTFQQMTFFSQPTISKSSFAIVSSGDNVLIPSGHRVISTVGILENPPVMNDSSGVMRAFSSILSTLIFE